MTWTIPNLLTVLRIAVIPVFMLAYYLPFSWGFTLAALLFAFAAVTDWLDGFLARMLNQTSSFGAFLDPVADKLMVAAALVVLVDKNPLPLPDLVLVVPAIVIIGREIAISALREWMAVVGESAAVAVSMVGKVKTTLQMIAIFLLIWRQPILDLPTVWIGLTLLYVATALTLWSMWRYLVAAWPTLRADVGGTNDA